MKNLVICLLVLCASAFTNVSAGEAQIKQAVEVTVFNGSTSTVLQCTAVEFVSCGVVHADLDTLRPVLAVPWRDFAGADPFNVDFSTSPAEALHDKRVRAQRSTNSLHTYHKFRNPRDGIRRS